MLFHRSEFNSCSRVHYSRLRMLRLSSSSTAGLWLSLLRKNTRITFWTIFLLFQLLLPGSSSYSSSSTSATSGTESVWLSADTSSPSAASAGAHSAESRASTGRTARPAATPTHGRLVQGSRSSASGIKSASASSIARASHFCQRRKKSKCQGMVCFTPGKKKKKKKNKVLEKSGSEGGCVGRSLRGVPPVRRMLKAVSGEELRLPTTSTIFMRGAWPRRRFPVRAARSSEGGN